MALAKREARDEEQSVAQGSVAATPILDWGSEPLQALLVELRSRQAARVGGQKLLIDAHGLIAARVKPAYALEEWQRVSRTVERGRGSCSQRLAVLEAVARASGIPTRVRGLLVDSRFWYPRFPMLRFAAPDKVVLAWPEFQLDGDWTSVSELFGSLGTLSAASGFTNADGETLFEAVARTAVDWDGTASTAGSTCDLSATVLRDLGRFNSRDELFALHGQTLSWPARKFAEPVLGGFIRIRRRQGSAPRAAGRAALPGDRQR
jgi:hypothetical protein